MHLFNRTVLNVFLSPNIPNFRNLVVQAKVANENFVLVIWLEIPVSLGLFIQKHWTLKLHSKLRRGIDIDPNRNFLKIAILRVHRSDNPSPNFPILGYLMLWQFLSWHSRNSLSPSLWFERNWPEHIQFLLGLSMEGWGII